VAGREQQHDEQETCDREDRSHDAYRDTDARVPRRARRTYRQLKVTSAPSMLRASSLRIALLVTSIGDRVSPEPPSYSRDKPLVECS
jgi:hypothetical protein